MSKVRRFPKAGTIGHMVLCALKTNPNVKSDELAPAILEKFPESAWNPAHLAWYRHQVRTGAYNLDEAPVQVEKPTRAKRRAKKEAPTE